VKQLEVLHSAIWSDCGAAWMISGMISLGSHREMDLYARRVNLRQHHGFAMGPPSRSNSEGNDSGFREYRVLSVETNRLDRSVGSLREWLLVGFGWVFAVWLNCLIRAMAVCLFDPTLHSPNPVLIVRPL
jgi:hypothetical protein